MVIAMLYLAYHLAIGSEPFQEQHLVKFIMKIKLILLEKVAGQTAWW